MAKAQQLAMAFGAMSAGIGVWYAAAPRHFLSVIGARPSRRRITVTRLVAAQEMAVGLSLLADGRATRWLAMRVAGDRGTEVRVRLDYAPPGGRLGAGVARLLGEEPDNQVAGDLRRLKQILETGEVVVSEAVVGGRSRRQRPAQPAEPATAAA